MKSGLLGFLLSISALVLSVNTNGQATCIAVIDGTRTEFCVGSGSVTFSNAVAVGENIEWLSLGDGTFDNRFAVNPTYTPGSTDRSRGYAYILLDVFKDDTVDYCSELPWVKLNFGSAVATPASQSVCTGSSITNIVLSSSIAGTTYSWTRDNTTNVTGIAASGTGNITGTLTNNTGNPITVTFTILASNGVCTGAPTTATVQVSPRPTAVASISSQSICSGSNITSIIISGNQGDATYSWTRNNTSSVTGIASSGTGNITGGLTKTSGLTTTTVTFTITPRLNGCTGTAITSTVAVSTSAVAVAGTPSSQTVCSGSPIATIVPSGGSGSTTYSWTRDNTANVTGIATSGSGSINGTLTNTTVNPAYVTFTLSRSGNSCTNRATVLVNPSPVATATPSSQSICSGAAIADINLSSNIAGTIYNWTRNNTANVTGIAAGGSGNITGSLVNTTSSPITVTFNITPTFNGCDGTAITANVIVNPNPSTVVITPLSQTICSGTAITTISGNGSGINYNWVRDNVATVTGLANNGTGSIQGTLTNTGPVPAIVTFTITPEAGGCTGTAVTATAIVNPRPAAVISGSQTICTGGVAPSISITLTGASPWSFTYSDGTTPVTVNGNSTNPYTFTVPAVAKTYTVTTVSDANCTAQAADITGSAVISQLNYAIAASAGANGFITPGGTTDINCGNNQTYLITANQGYNIADVLVDGVSIGAVASYTFNNVNTTHSISAAFTIATHTITASSATHGNISPAGITNVQGESSQSYSITADNCYQIADVLVDGVSVGAVASYTFNNVTAAHTINATFSQINYAITASAGANGTITPSGTNNVACGGNQTFTIAANNCYQIADVLVDGVSVGAVASYTFSNVTAAHTISATFSQINYAVTASAGENGTITPSGANNIACSGSQTFTIAPISCYQIADVLVDGVSVGAVASYTFNNVTAAHTISATFSQIKYTITATAGNNGSITPSGSLNINCGSNQTFIIAANSCYQIADVLVDGVSVGAVASYTFNNVTATHTISATFSQINYTINASTGANGTITPSGINNIACGGTQTFTIAANNCYQIADVLVDGVSVGVVTSYTFNNVTAPHTINATFSQISYTITASAGANGSVTPAGATSVNCGNNQTYTIAASSCYQIANVIVDGVSVGAVSSYTFNNVTASHTISATFSQLSYAITASAGSNGTITPSGANNIACGSNQTFAIAANSCYQIADVLVDGVSVGAVASYTFNNVSAAHTISATFSQLSYTINSNGGANGSVTPAGATRVICGNNQTYTIAANSCYQIADVLVDGVSVGAVASYTFNNVTAPHTISATFSQVKYTITANAGSNGSITPTGATNINCGGSQTCIIAANAGFNIQDVLVDGISVGTVASYTFNNVTTSHTISAVFNINTFIITASAGSNGSITPAGGIAVTGGSNQTFAIAANNCYQVANVIVDGVSVGAVASYTFNNVTASHTISATFSQISYSITASAGNNGSITNAGTNSITCGSNQTFTIAANSCYQIADVLVDGVSVGTVTSYTFNNVTAPHTISATFSQLSYTITASAGNNGSITNTGANSVICGANPTFTIAANSCYQIANVIVDGVSVGAVSSYTFNNVTAPHTISATFSQITYTITASAGANGSVTPAGAINTNCGANQTYTITANAGFSIQAVLVDGSSIGAVASYTFNNVTAPHTISATFVANPVNCTLSATATAANMGCNGTTTTLTVSVTGGTGARQYSLNGGAFQAANTFTVTPSGSPYIVTVKDAVNCIVNTNSVTVAPAPTAAPPAPTTILGPSTGLCSGGTFTYSVPAVPGATSYVWSPVAGFNILSGQGTSQIVMTVPAGFTGAPGLWVVSKNACGSVTGFRLALTATQTIPAANIAGPATVAAAQSNVQFSVPNEAGSTYNWQVPTGASITNGQGTSNITVTFGTTSGNVSVAVTNACGTGIRTNKPVSVVANSGPFTITASAGSNGNISPAGAVTVANGANQTFTITANSCYQIANVAVDGISVGAVASYTFNNVTAPHTINATFSQSVYAITASAGANGSITNAGSNNIICGTNQTFAIAANSCYQIADVLVDGVSVGAVTSYTFNNVTAPHTISAVFSQLSYTITASAGANGSVTPAGATNTNCGANQTYTITANAGFSVQAVLVDGVSIGAVASYTFNNVTASHTISATFIANTANCTLRATAAAANMGCNGTSTTLTVSATGGTGARQYSLNGGAFQSANTFTVTAEGSPYIVTVKDAGSCIATTNSVTVAPAPTAAPPAPTTILGPSTGLCSGGTFTYSVPAVPGATSYVWSPVAGFNILSGQGTSQIIMTVPAGFTGAPGLWVVSKNACGSVTGFRLALTATQTITAANISGPATVAAAQTNVQFSVPNEAGSTYNWQVPTGASITNGQGTSNITVTFGITSGNVSVAVTNACGTGTRTNKPVSIALSKSSSITNTERVISETVAKLNFSIYPNPANSNATVVFNYPKAGGKFQVIISSSLGYQVHTETGILMAGQNKLQLNLNKFKNGMYVVKLIMEDATQTVKLFKE